MKQLIVSAALAIVAIATASCGDQRTPIAPSVPPGASAGNQPKSMPALTQSASTYEINFMTGMIDHHQMAVMMGEACLDKAVHTELLALCQNIIATQSAEIDQMQAWLDDWYGIDYEPMMKPGAMKMIERLTALSATAFEIEFMETMIRHHRGAIIEARHCLQRAYHDELKTLCENIIETQSEEIELMEEWLCEWYGRCSGS